MAQFSYGSVLIVILTMGSVAITQTCPTECDCSYGEVAHLNTSMIITNCSGQSFEHLPVGLPNDTQYLDISNNSFMLVSGNRLAPLKDLRYLDVRVNPQLHSLPLMRGLHNLSAVYVDNGQICCILEMETERVEGKSGRKLASQICRPTNQYTECSKNLIRIPSFVIYSITLLASVILNPWVFIVTLVVRERRQDPFTLANIHFSTSNLMITVYAGGMLVMGACYYDKYHYNMEDWHNNRACGALGYLLVTASLASTFFYTFEIIIVFLKVKYPFQDTKHMSTLQLNIATAVTWIFSFGVAAIPFGQGRYNAVSLCLPFYAGDFDFSFKFVLLYTCITNVAAIFNMALHVYVLKLFISKSKESTSAMCAQRRKENRTLRNTVIITLIFYVIISLAEMIFLVMSCVGGTAGQIGREWWARMVVLEALVNPLTGPMRSKRFYTHTRMVFLNFKNRYIHSSSRRPSAIGKVVLDLKKFKDKTFKAENSKHAKCADSPSMVSDNARNGRTLNAVSSTSDASDSPDLPRINLSWLSLRSADNKVSTISSLNLDKLKDKMTAYQTELGASPMSKATLVSEISDTESERGIT